MPDPTLPQLLTLSHQLGDPAAGCAILGEGNTSARIDDDTFYVKASGTTLATLTESGLVRVRFDKALALLDDPHITDDQVREGLKNADADAEGERLPSVETAVHAALLTLEGVRFVGHTHPTPINAIACSARFDDLAGRLFPDQVVVCGPAAVLVPYVDPGVPLAIAIRDRVRAYMHRRGEVPKTIYLQSHGFIALGQTASQVADITAMAVKAAHILLGSYPAGGPRFMAPAHVDRIHTRPDEHYRQKIIAAAEGR